MTQWGLDVLFNPAKRHMDDEKRRLQSTREQIGDSSGGKRIDLDSGKVTIRRPGGAAATSEETEADETEADETETDETETETAETETAETETDHADGDAGTGIEGRTESD